MDRDKRKVERICCRKVSIHSDVLRSSLSKRSTAKFDLHRDFLVIAQRIQRILGPESGIVRSKLDIEGRFDINERENVNPCFKTETLKTCEVTMAELEIFITLNCRLFNFLEGRSRHRGIVAANAGNGE